MPCSGCSALHGMNLNLKKILGTNLNQVLVTVIRFLNNTKGCLE